jgi:N-acetylneuraminic acid mutarotase
VLAALLVPACGGGGGGSNAGTAPRISDLVYGPTAVYVASGGGTQLLSGEFDFSDPDGDLASATLEALDDSGTVIDSQTIPIEGVAGMTSGTIVAEVEVDTSTVGTFTVRVTVTDRRGLRSNSLTATFRISEFPWLERDPMPAPRREFATAMVDGKIYVLGGGDTRAPVIPSPATKTVQVYNPATDTWSTAAPMPVATRNHAAAAVGGKIYVVGGEGEAAPGLKTLQVFDPVAGVWTLKAEMPYELRGSAATSVGGRLYVFGGDGLGFDTSNALSYDPVTNTWSSHAPMLHAGHDMAAVTVGDRALVLGGYSILDSYSRFVQQYDPAQDTWTARADMLIPRMDLAAAVIGETVFAIGGGNWERALSDVHAFDVATDQWTGKEQMRKGLDLPEAKMAWPRAETVDGRIYVFDTATTLEYTPSNDIR